MLMLCGDAFLTRLPDPVLQQLEHFGNPTLGVNDAFKPVSRYWDRITHPAQIIQSLPAAIANMLDPADCGPAFWVCRRMCRAGPMTTLWQCLRTQRIISAVNQRMIKNWKPPQTC